MSDASQILGRIITAAVSVQFARQIAVAAYALQVYEWLICFSDEYLYVHKARWTSLKLAYLLCRYFPLFFFPAYIWLYVGNHPLSVCAKVLCPLHIFHAFFPLFAQPVIMIRTYAFTGRNKFILAFLVACWIAIVGCILWIESKAKKPLVELHLLFGDTACFPSGGDKMRIPLALYHLGVFFFDFLMTAIVFIHCIRFRTLWGPLGKAFVVQGLIAFVAMSALNLAIAVMFFNPVRTWQGLSICGGIASDIIACRLILTLRRRGDPAATTQVRNDSQLIQDALGRLSAAENIAVDADRNQPIEGWD